MKRITKATAIAAATLIALGSTSAASAAGSSNVVYNGNGFTAGVLNTDAPTLEQDPAQDGYLLWVLSANGATNATITLPDGTHAMVAKGGNFKFESQYFSPDKLKTVAAAYTGSVKGNVVLTVSHGHAVAPAPICPAPLPAPAAVASASGDVAWDVLGGYNGSPLTGTVVFDAKDDTGGTLHYTNSLGWWLDANVTPGTVKRNGNAVTFDGAITATNAYGGGGYIHAKVVDGGGATCGGDTIVVFVNEAAYDGIFANVTSGDLTVV